MGTLLEGFSAVFSSLGALFGCTDGRKGRKTGQEEGKEEREGGRREEREERKVKKGGDGIGRNSARSPGDQYGRGGSPPQGLGIGFDCMIEFGKKD